MRCKVLANLRLEQGKCALLAAHRLEKLISTGPSARSAPVHAAEVALERDADSGATAAPAALLHGPI